jgi:hypothetical protein
MGMKNTCNLQGGVAALKKWGLDLQGKPAADTVLNNNEREDDCL